MSFDELFGRPEPEDDEPDDIEPDIPPWWGPAQDELGVCVALNSVIARSERGLVTVSHALVYSTGVELHFDALARGLKESDVHGFFHGMHHHGAVEDLPASFLRIGVELADGSRASNLGGRMHRDFEEEPDGPVFHQHGGGGGGGGGGRYRSQPAYWLWPMPPPGPLRVSCEWPALEIPLSTAELDASALNAAASQSRSIWED